MYNYVHVSIWFLIIGFILNKTTSINKEEFDNDCRSFEKETTLNIICSNGSMTSIIQYVFEMYNENSKVLLKIQDMYIEELTNEHFFEITGDKYEVNFLNNYIQNIEIGRDVLQHRLHHNIIFDISSPKNSSDLSIATNEHYTIDFSSNTIRNLKPGVFSYLQNNPKFIRFIKCNLTYIPKDVFTDLNFVYVIDLSYNNLFNLSKSTFVNITVDEDVEWIYEFKNSTVINLNHCGIRSMEDETFERLGLQTLNLSNNFLTTIPRHLFRDCKIYSLDLSNNHIRKFNSMSFASIGLSLQQLYLTNNQLSVLRSNTFEKNSKLENIYLQDNPIEHIEPNAFIGLKNIRNKTFDIQQRNIILPYELKFLELMPYTFNGLKYMVELDLSDRSILEIYPESFHGLIRLEYLRLNNNLITTLRPATFVGLYSIFWIEIMDNLICQLDSKSFSGLTHAHRFYLLNMKNNNISQLPDKIFTQTPSLKILNLESNSLVRIKERTLIDLEDLAILNLSKNQLTHFQVPVMRSLGTLLLNDNNLSKIDIDTLIKNLRNLRKLDLNGNQWPCPVLDDIVTKLNTTEIDFASSIETNYTESNVSIFHIQGIVCYNISDTFSNYSDIADNDESILMEEYIPVKKEIEVTVDIDQFKHYLDGSNNDNVLIHMLKQKESRMFIFYFLFGIELCIFLAIFVLSRMKHRLQKDNENENNDIGYQ